MLNAKTHNPSKPGNYNIMFANVRTFMPIFADWDGEQWLDINKRTGFPEDARGDMFFYDPELETK